jgi:Tfp pilus assembly protein PilF
MPKPVRSKPAQARTQIPDRKPAITVLVVTTIVLLVALSARGNQFVNFDDPLYVGTKPASDGLTTEAVAFAFTSVGTLYWHPLTWLSHELDTELFGAVPAGHHFTSVVLHALTAGLLCIVLIQIGATVFQAAAGSLLWALHPLRVESFAWVAERKDVLCALFFLATIAIYLRYVKQPSPARYAGWLCCGMLALMSKPTAVSLPTVLLLLDFWPRFRQITLTKLLLEKVPLISMAALVLCLTVLGQDRSNATSLLSQLPLHTRLANAAAAYPRYLGKIIWPVNLSCFYPYHRNVPLLSVTLSVCFLGAVTAFAIVQRTRRPWLLLGWAWFVIVLLPNAGIVQAGRQSIADRFTHIPMIGLVISVLWTVAELQRPESHKAIAWITCGVLAACAFLTVRQIAFWRDSVTLFEHAISVEDSDYIRGNLATTLMQEGKYVDAEPHLLAAIRLAPDRFEHHNNLANVLLRTGRIDHATAEANIALRLGPESLAVANTAGLVFLRGGNYGSALKQFDHAIQLGDDAAQVAAKLSDAGASLASHGNPQDAEPLLRKAITLNPQLVQARRNLVLVLLDQHRIPEARASLQQAIHDTGAQPEYRDLISETETRKPLS